MTLNPKDFPISAEQESIINGYIMADGYLNSRGALQVDQGKDQKKFVEWMFKKLRNLCTKDCVIAQTKVKKTGELKSYRFTTRSVLKDYRKRWYQKLQTSPKTVFSYQKVLPPDIGQIFTKDFIAVWYAGDGTKIIGSLGAKFEVTAFTPNERQMLKKLFKEKFGIETVINQQGVSRKGTPQWAICINAAEYPKFHDLIADHELIKLLFTYKLHY